MSEGLPAFWSKQVIARAAEIYGVPVDDVIGKSRIHGHVLPRFSAAYAMRNYSMSYSEIGRRLGGRDHSSAMHAVTMAEVYAEHDDQFCDRLADIIDAARTQRQTELMPMTVPTYPQPQPQKTPEEIHEEGMAEGSAMLGMAIDEMLAGRVPVVPQELRWTQGTGSATGLDELPPFDEPHGLPTVDSRSCFKCGVRRSVGCKHRPASEGSQNNAVRAGKGALFLGT